MRRRPPPRGEELAFAVEDHHRVLAPAEDVDAGARVCGDARDLPKRPAVGDLRPIGVRLVDADIRDDASPRHGPRFSPHRYIIEARGETATEMANLTLKQAERMDLEGAGEGDATRSEGVRSRGRRRRKPCRLLEDGRGGNPHARHRQGEGLHCDRVQEPLEGHGREDEGQAGGRPRPHPGQRKQGGPLAWRRPREEGRRDHSARSG